MLNENHITDLLANYFVNLEYEVLGKLTTIEKGIDLIVKNKQGQITYVEVKGETSARTTSRRYGLPFNKNQIDVHIGKALLATFRAINKFKDNENEFAIAFPGNIGHEAVLKDIKYVLDKLNIKIYLVSETNVRIL